jgi:hypothetical protein
MSRTRRSFTTEYKVEAAHRVIDSGRTIAELPAVKLPVMTTPIYNIPDIVVDGRTVPRATPELWMTFADKADTDTLPDTFDSGQTATALAGYGTNGQQYIENGYLTSAPSGTSPTAGFITGELSANATRIGARFVFNTGGSTTQGDIVLAILSAPITQEEAEILEPPSMAIHLGVYSTGWTLGYVDTSYAEHSIAVGEFYIPLAADGVTEYETEVWVIDDTCIIRLPDGSWTAPITDSHIAEYAGP